MDSMDQTRKFDAPGASQELSPRDVLVHVYTALEEKGYDPIQQLVGYLISGEPAYIPRHNNARGIIRKVPRDDLIEMLLRYYLEREFKGQERE
ncbi:MAG: IreB family regulatory phosphoprotein [Hydrogenibacillus sp.]|nr:IreB family regulatory phosphoprotein [Hydrogenibacillus sp.]